MKTIGIIGGLGPQATMDFETRLHKVSQKLIPQFVNQGYPKLWVYYHRNAPMQIDDQGLPLDNKLTPDPELLEASKQMGQLVDFIVIASNTPHFFQKDIENSSGKKVLSMVDCVINEIKKRGIKRAGVLAIGATLKNRLYQDRLEKEDVEWESINEDLWEELDNTIMAVMEGKNPKTLSKPALNAIKILREKGCDGIILGCTELPLLIGEEQNLPDIINSSQLLAEFAIHQAI